MDRRTIAARINKAWDTASYFKVEWLEMEQTIRAIFNNYEITDSDKLALIDEAIGAYTKRGMAR